MEHVYDSRGHYGVHDPGFVAISRIDRNRFDADRNFRDQNWVVGIRNIENGKAGIGSVHGEEPRAIRRNADRTDLFPLKIDEVLRRADQGRRTQQHGEEGKGQTSPE